MVTKSLLLATLPGAAPVVPQETVVLRPLQNDVLEHLGEPRMLRREEVERITGMSRSWICAAMKAGHFPRQVAMGPRAVRWSSTDIPQWRSNRVATSNQNQGGAK